MGSKHTYQLLTKAAFQNPAFHTIFHSEALNYLKPHKSQIQKTIASTYYSLYQRYKSYRLFILLRQWQISNEAKRLIQSHYNQKPRNPE